jgi:hypothetical protein
MQSQVIDCVVHSGAHGIGVARCKQQNDERPTAGTPSPKAPETAERVLSGWQPDLKQCRLCV